MRAAASSHELVALLYAGQPVELPQGTAAAPADEVWSVVNDAGSISSVRQSRTVYAA